MLLTLMQCPSSLIADIPQINSSSSERSIYQFIQLPVWAWTKTQFSYLGCLYYNLSTKMWHFIAHLWLWICDPGLKVLHSADWALMCLTFLQVYQEHSFHLLQTIWQPTVLAAETPTGSGPYVCTESQIMIKIAELIVQCSLLLFVFPPVLRMPLFVLK